MSALYQYFRRSSFVLAGALAGVFLFCTLPGFSATPLDSLQGVYARQAFFGRVYPQERVYLHMDKPYYQLGDQ